MALSNCPMCWERTCECGYQYKNWTIEQRVKLANILLNEEAYQLKMLELEKRYMEKYPI